MKQYFTLGLFFLCLWALTGTARGAEPPAIDLSHGWPAAAMLRAFDQAAQLQPPSNEAKGDLRIWVAPSLGPTTTGYVITSGRALKCSADYKNNGLTATVVGAQCTAAEMPAQIRSEALALLPKLSALNGKTWACALGGNTFFVEGFLDRERFAFISSNPGFGSCTDPDSTLVVRLIALVTGPVP
jgi:hypothetical protein